MMTDHTVPHLDDDVIVRALDEQLAPFERAEAAAHLAACPRCAGRLRQLERRGSRLAALLRTTDFDTPPATVPSRRPRPFVQRTWVRAAAGVVLLLGVAMTFTPVQALVMDWLRAEWSRLVGDAPPPVDSPASARGTRVEFVHASTTFRIEVRSEQDAGTLTVRRGPGDLASADASRAGVELLVLPAGLRIMNTPASASDYEVVVPAAVTEATVVIGSRVVARVDEERLESGVRLPLR